MRTDSEVKVISKSTKREIRIVCPECLKPNFVKVDISLPAQSGEVECYNCGATLEYQEVLPTLVDLLCSEP